MERDTFTISLHAPGMTPMLRAGLGGLAASIRALAREADPAASWPASLKLGPGEVRVAPAGVTFRWGGDAAATLAELFAGSFRLRGGIIYLPGAYPTGHPWDTGLGIAFQAGLKRTFLQHGKTTKKAGSTRAVEIEIDGERHPFELQPFETFAHQGGAEKVVKALNGGSVRLAGWANPGAITRHDAYKADTSWEYDAGQALCGFFALVGCISYEVAESGGASALVVLEPADLVRFAELRPRLSARRMRDAYVAGASDAVLTVSLLLRMEEHRGRAAKGVASVTAMTLRTLPWAPQQKTRSSTVSGDAISEAVLDAYDDAVKTLPNVVRVRRAAKAGPKGSEKAASGEGDGESEGFFVTRSALRGFISENLAWGKPWYAGFATAKTGADQSRYLHRYREGDDLGALRREEREGLSTMIEKIEELEKRFVESVHVALRQRFGAIADEADNPVTRGKRFEGEHDKWRLAFAGAKTHEQVRAALADLWSRAGSNRVLQEHWPAILAMLRPDRWQAARDLALVALVSYPSGRAAGGGGEGRGKADEGAG